VQVQACIAGVSMTPGRMPLHRIPRLPNVVAIVWTYQLTIALDAPYENCATSPASELVEDVNRTTPLPRASMCGSAIRVASTPPSTFTRTTS
jgi:hypothetical protein